MRGYMARLGNYTFSINTAAFQQLSRSSSYRWQAVNRIGRKPAQQNTGQGADTIKLQGTIYPYFRGGLGQLAMMRAQAGKGIALPLVYTDTQAGQFAGNFCITEIEETRTVFFEDGKPRKIEFSLSLVEYGEDGEDWAVTQTGLMKKNLSKIAASKSLFPTITGNAALDQAFSKARSLVGDIANGSGSVLANLKTQLTTAQSFATELGDQFLTVKNAIIEGIDSATGIRGSCSAALSLLGDVPDISRITAATTILTEDIAQGVQSVTRSSNAITTVFGSLSSQPADLVTCLRSSSRSIGQLSRLCTDTTIAAQRIRRSLE